MRAASFFALAAVLASCGRGPVDVQTLKERAAAGSRRAGNELVAALADPDAARAGEARRAVLSLGAEAEPFLQGALRSADPGIFEAAAAALGNMRSRAAIDDLSAALSDRSRPRRYVAAWALGEIADPSATALLVSGLADPDRTVRKECVRALVRMGRPARAQTAAFLAGAPGEEGERGAILVLGELGDPQAVPLLLGVKGANRDVAVRALGRIGRPEALPDLLAALNDDRQAVRREAAEALGALGDPSAAPALGRALDDPEPVVREWAARSLEVVTGHPVLYLGEEGKMIRPYNLYR